MYIAKQDIGIGLDIVFSRGNIELLEEKTITVLKSFNHAGHDQHDLGLR